MLLGYFHGLVAAILPHSRFDFCAKLHSVKLALYSGRVTRPKISTGMLNRPPDLCNFAQPASRGIARFNDAQSCPR